MIEESSPIDDAHDGCFSMREQQLSHKTRQQWSFCAEEEALSSVFMPPVENSGNTV
jgi:hypothetical protein